MIQSMIDAMSAAIAEFFGNGWIATFVLSMIPLIELKGAILVGSTTIGVVPSFVMAYLGSTLVFVPLFFLLRPILNLLKRIKWFRRLAVKVEYLFEHKAEKISKKGQDAGEKARVIMMWGVFAFVAVPLPMTGVWTGTAIAVFLGLKFWDAFFPVAVGNLVAGLLISLFTWIFKDYVQYVILALGIGALALLVLFIVKVVRIQPPPERYSDTPKMQDSDSCDTENKK